MGFVLWRFLIDSVADKSPVRSPVLADWRWTAAPSMLVGCALAVGVRGELVSTGSRRDSATGFCIRASRRHN